MDFETLLERYELAMRFTDEDEIGQKPFSDELTQKCHADVLAFISKAQLLDLLTVDQLPVAVIDFWYTRNGHGCGFWDGDWPEHGDELTNLAREFAPVELYVADDGLVYC